MRGGTNLEMPSVCILYLHSLELGIDQSTKVINKERRVERVSNALCRDFPLGLGTESSPVQRLLSRV